MKLYKINDQGELVDINRLEFDESEVYILDDDEKNTIYIWVGLKVSEAKKGITADIARKFESERGYKAKILIMKQNREYGSFLAMMHDLSRGLIPGSTIERRPELTLEKPSKTITTEISETIQSKEENDKGSRVVKWFKQFNKLYTPKTKENVEVIVNTEEEEEEEEEQTSLKEQIRETAYYLSLDKYSYNDLCWMLAEKIQKINMKMPSIEDIRTKAEEVFNSSCSYDELCWLNAEMEILIEKHHLTKPEKKIEFY